jgi:hypothetical protein
MLSSVPQSQVHPWLPKTLRPGSGGYISSPISGSTAWKAGSQAEIWGAGVEEAGEEPHCGDILGPDMSMLRTWQRCWPVKQRPLGPDVKAPVDLGLSSRNQLRAHLSFHCCCACSGSPGPSGCCTP